MTEEQPRQAPRPAPRREPARPPGQLLQRWLHQHHRTQVWLAGELDISAKHVSNIVRGRSGYGYPIALRLSRITGMDREFWAELQARWRISQHQHEPAGSRRARERTTGYRATPDERRQQ